MNVRWYGAPEVPPVAVGDRVVVADTGEVVGCVQATWPAGEGQLVHAEIAIGALVGVHASRQAFRVVPA